MSRRGVALFAVMAVVWGIPYLLIKVAVGELDPTSVVMLRTGVGATVLVPAALYRRALRPALRHWRVVLVYTGIEVAAPWWLIADAEQRVTSSLAGLVIAATPLVGAVLALWLGRERLGVVRLSGLLVGLVGVGALLGLDLAAGADLPAVLQLVLTAVLYAVGPVFITRYLGAVPALGVNAVALTVTALVYLPVGGARLPKAWPSAPVVVSVAVLGVVCTALALLAFFALIAEVGSARAVVITYLNPAVAVVLGVGLLDEPITTGILVGFPLVIVGSVLATRRSGPATVPAAAD